MNYITLKNDIKMPQIGLGTWQITDRESMKNIISQAYLEGYRLIDTAAAYSNEIAVGKAISETGIPRNEWFISDKVWNTSRGYHATQTACKKSLKKLKTDYLDLYLIHWPASMKLYDNWAEINADTWRGMEQLYKDGYVKAIGVCNFKIHHLKEIKKTAEIMPFINQIELHPGMNQNELLAYCLKNQIQIEASSPLGNGKIITNPVLESIAARMGKTPAQVALRWVIQKGIVAIPKTSKVKRLRDNIRLFDFELSSEDMITINEIPYCGGMGIDPDEVVEFG